MKMTDIKAPDALKKQTLTLMKKEHETVGRPLLLLPAAAACGLLIASLIVFGKTVDSEQTAQKAGRTIVSTGQETAVQLSANDSSSPNEAFGIMNPNSEDFVPYGDKPSADRTSADDVAAIKSAFSLQCPLTDYQVSWAYNDFQENGKPLHPGTDMAAPEGTEIYPLCAGTVLETGYTVASGRYIIIDHGEGLVSSYAHCNEVLVSIGDTVTAASAIATVGKTGMATGPFLAFSVTWDGKPVNPETLFD